MDAPTIQDILREHYPAFERTHKVSDAVREAVHCMCSCRTAALGGHKQICPDGHITRIWYNSCKHRVCPQCAYLQKMQWLAEQQARLLDCDHYHAIFTLPHDLNDLWQANFRFMANLLFRTVRKLLLDMLADPRYLGARPGIIMALHTWGQTLILHPHIHCLISGGGLDGEHWKAVKNGFLLPVVLLMERFRERFLNALRRALAKKKLRLPPEKSAADLVKVFARIEKIKWNVHIRERYAHGEGVAHYLARYLRGGPIGNSRLLPAPDGKVRFSYHNNHDKDEAGQGKPDTMTLPAEQFLQRLFAHVPPQRMQTVRACGLYARTKTEALDRARALLGQAPFENLEKTHWQDACAENGEDHPECCPVCGKRLIRGETIPPKKKPPRAPPRVHPDAPPLVPPELLR